MRKLDFETGPVSFGWRKALPDTRPMHHFAEAAKIWQMEVPRSGQAITVEGELLRAVEKLRDEAERNGNVNWDGGFQTLLAFLGDKLLDEKVYPKPVLADTRVILARLHDYKNPCTDDELYDRLADRVVEYYRHYGSQPRVKNPHLHR